MRIRTAIAPVLYVMVSAAVDLSCSDKIAGQVSGPVARFSLSKAVPNYLDVPYPSDLYLQGGKVIDPVPGVDAYVTSNSKFITHELAKMNGFSRSALANFIVDNIEAGAATPVALDPSSLPTDETTCSSASSPVFLIDLEATGSSPFMLPCRALVEADEASSLPPTLAVGPARGIVLEEAHKYAVVLTNRLRDLHGKKLQASVDFASLSAAKGKSPLYQSAYRVVSNGLKSALAADGSEVVSMSVFTTHSMTRDMFNLRATIDAAPAPTLAWDKDSLAPLGAVKFSQTTTPGFTATLDDWLGVYPLSDIKDGSEDPNADLPVVAHDKIAAVGTAVFSSMNFLQNLGDYTTLDHATFLYDAMGNIAPPAKNPTAPIWVTFAIPTSPMPPTGYPAVIIQHGLNGSRADVLSQMNVFAAEGWVVVAIDSVTFGARAPEAMYRVDQASDYQGNGAVYQGPDGISDTVKGSRNGSSDLFGTLQNVGALRDQMRQAALDTVQLVRVLRSNPDLSPLKTGATVPTIDPSRVAYVGQSLGGIQGAMAAAIEPAVSLWTLNVAGAGLLVELGAHAPAIAMEVKLAAGFNFSMLGGYYDEGHPLVGLIQQVADPGDPIGFAGMLVKHPGTVAGNKVPPRNILQFEVLFDEVVGNEANEALARAGGWGMATPNQGSNAGFVDLKNPANNHGLALLQVDPDSSGAIHDTPIPGVTAVVVQSGPSTHGVNMLGGMGTRNFSIPFGAPGVSQTFAPLGKTFAVRCPYATTLSTMTDFIAAGFGGGVPTVTVKAPAVRDTDDDSFADDIDSDPNNPKVH